MWWLTDAFYATGRHCTSAATYPCRRRDVPDGKFGPRISSPLREAMSVPVWCVSANTSCMSPPRTADVLYSRPDRRGRTGAAHHPEVLVEEAEHRGFWAWRLALLENTFRKPTSCSGKVVDGVAEMLIKRFPSHHGDPEQICTGHLFLHGSGVSHSLPRFARLIIEQAASDQIFIAGVCVVEFSGSVAELGLAQLDDRAAAGVVAGLGK